MTTATKRQRKTYNGHRSWACWNVSLWIGNDEGLYNMAKENIRRHRTLDTAALAIKQDLDDMGITKTPDGAPYSLTAIRLAIREL